MHKSLDYDKLAISFAVELIIIPNWILMSVETLAASVYIGLQGVGYVTIGYWYTLKTNAYNINTV